MGGLSRWAVRKPWYALGAWVVLMIAVFTLGGAFGGKLNDSFSLPETDSLRAQELLDTAAAIEASRDVAKLLGVAPVGHLAACGTREFARKSATTAIAEGGVNPGTGRWWIT